MQCADGRFETVRPISREDGSRSQLALRPDNLRWLFEEYNRLAAGEEVDFAGRSQLPSPPASAHEEAVVLTKRGVPGLDRLLATRFSLGATGPLSSLPQTTLSRDLVNAHNAPTNTYARAEDARDYLFGSFATFRFGVLYFFGCQG